MVDQPARAAAGARGPSTQELFHLPVGTELARRPSTQADKGRVQGVLPLDRRAALDRRHPAALVRVPPEPQGPWFLADDLTDLPRSSPQRVRESWDEIDEDDAGRADVDRQGSADHDRVHRPSRCRSRSLPSRKRDTRPPRRAQLDRVLNVSASTRRTSARSADARIGVPRSPYRERLALPARRAAPALDRRRRAAGRRQDRRSLRRWIADRLAEDGYPLHQNLDRVHHVLADQPASG